MTQVPRNPKIYHITHVDNFDSILSDGGLRCDSVIASMGGPAQTIGMSRIKQRRIGELEVHCHPGTKVGDYVPFYFCPRSIMLYVIHKGNDPSLAYQGGQDRIVHLVADLQTVIRWAERNDRRWAFSLSNAGAAYTEFRSSSDDLNEINWQAIHSTDFREPDIKHGKQAEFLCHEHFPFELVERIGVLSNTVHDKVVHALNRVQRKLPVEIRRNWYY